MAAVKLCPIRLDPTTTPSRFTSEPFALAEKPSLRDAGDRERVEDPAGDGEGDEREQGGEELAPHQTSPERRTTRSISLIPMKGAITPPAP